MPFLLSGELVDYILSHIESVNNIQSYIKYTKIINVMNKLEHKSHISKTFCKCIRFVF